ncbi:MAG: type II secretion system protein [Candidatus Daviesbacteria bacterium]
MGKEIKDKIIDYCLQSTVYRCGSRKSVVGSRKSGFTLIELMVTISILGVLMVIVLPRIGSYQSQQTLKDAAAQLQTNLRRAQNNAASGVKCSDSPATNWILEVVDETKYQMKPTCSSPVTTPLPLPSNVTISKINIDGCPNGSSLNGMGVAFNNISASVNFQVGNSGCLPLGANKMVFTLTSNSKYIDVTIEKGGNIYVENVY